MWDSKYFYILGGAMKYNILTCSNMIIAGLALCLLPPAVLARSTKLVEPDPVTINCNLSAEKMMEGIRTGGAVRHWTVVSQSPGNAVLRYIKGNNKHILTVNVSYTSSTFAVTYKDSVNLKYRVGENLYTTFDEYGDRVEVGGNGVEADMIRYIHPKPVGWMRNLSSDIQEAANDLCFN
jgi:hypothetical protein